MLGVELTVVLRRLYNQCVNDGYFPIMWKVGDLRLIMKSPEADVTAVKSYRPIKLLPIFSKELERLVSYSLETFIQK